MHGCRPRLWRRGAPSGPVQRLSPAIWTRAATRQGSQRTSVALEKTPLQFNTRKQMFSIIDELQVVFNELTLRVRRFVLRRILRGHIQVFTIVKISIIYAQHSSWHSGSCF